jgi:hypothetical protein
LWRRLSGPAAAPGPPPAPAAPLRRPAGSIAQMPQGRRRWALLAAAVLFCTGAASPPPPKVVARIDLSKPFRVAPGATFTAAQAPPIDHPFYDGEKVAGPIHLCVRVKPSGPCAPNLDDSLKIARDADMFSEIHFLDTSELVYPRGRLAPPMLHLQVSSLHSGNGNQRRSARILAYRPRSHRFEIIFDEQFGRNNNEEVRYIASGPLKGSVISAYPTDDAPFGYWVTVNRLTPDYRYKRILRYRSATHYGDGNPLAVIDSEMPNIFQRLRLWRPGEPLPLPKTACPRPHLVNTALWCS